MSRDKDNAIEVIKKELIKRDNPTDLKCAIIGKIVQLNPIIVSINDGNILLKENDELIISEWFKFRCAIDKTGVLSVNVPEYTENAKAVTETHSESGLPCAMPNAIIYLASAIIGVRDELLALKCELQTGDSVVVATLEDDDKYILMDKI